MAGAAAGSGRYRAFAARLRQTALRRRLVDLPPGLGLERGKRGSRSEPSLVAALAGVWVAVGPWVWGYDDVPGALVSASLSGGAVILLSLGTVVFPALWALVLLAGTWLLLAPWLVGYGDTGGPVGLSDTVAGAVVCSLAIAGLVAAEKALRARSGVSGRSAIGRLRRRG